MSTLQGTRVRSRESMSAVKLFDTGSGSRNRIEVPRCPDCGSSDIRYLKFKQARCQRCGLVRVRRVFKERAERRVFA